MARIKKNTYLRAATAAAAREFECGV